MTTGITNVVDLAGDIWDSIVGLDGYLNIVLENGVLLLPVGFMFCRRIAGLFGRMVGLGGRGRK